MISFLAVVVLTKVYTGVYKEHRANLEKKEREEARKGGGAESAEGAR